MDTFLAIASRRDQRRYVSGRLPEPTVHRILDAGRLSGSSKNRQPWSFVVPETPERVAALADTVWVPENVRSAGLVVAVVVPTDARASFDAGRAAQNMLLAAWNDGVASCPNGVHDAAGASAALALAADEAVAIVLTFGLPARRRDVDARSPEEWSAAANRRPLDEIVRSVG